MDTDDGRSVSDTVTVIANVSFRYVYLPFIARNH
jgi:hypothetical protein